MNKSFYIGCSLIMVLRTYHNQPTLMLHSHILNTPMVRHTRTCACNFLSQEFTVWSGSLWVNVCTQQVLSKMPYRWVCRPRVVTYWSVWHRGAWHCCRQTGRPWRRSFDWKVACRAALSARVAACVMSVISTKTGSKATWVLIASGGHQVQDRDLYMGPTRGSWRCWGSEHSLRLIAALHKRKTRLPISIWNYFDWLFLL